MDSKIVTELRVNVLRSPRLYIGHERWDTDALHFLVQEIVKLATQSESSNECSSVAIVVEPTGELRVTDNGRGLPVFPICFGKGERRAAVEHVFTYIITRHPDYQYYQKYGFLDYLGAVLNTVTAQLSIDTTVNGERYSLACSRGKITTPLHKTDSAAEKGTQIIFLPDPEVFSEFTFNADRIIEDLQRLSANCPLTCFAFEDKRTGRRIEWSNAPNNNQQDIQTDMNNPAV